MSHAPAGTSTTNIFHWAQMYRSQKIQKFDFGSDIINFKHYGQVYFLFFLNFILEF